MFAYPVQRADEPFRTRSLSNLLLHLFRLYWTDYEKILLGKRFLEHSFRSDGAGHPDLRPAVLLVGFGHRGGGRQEWLGIGAGNVRRRVVRIGMSKPVSRFYVSTILVHLMGVNQGKDEQRGSNSARRRSCRNVTAA